MKKIILYISFFIIGIGVGVFIFSGSDLINNSSRRSENTDNYLTVEKPGIKQKNDFVQSAIPMLGKDIIINGTIQEGYKNIENEMVLYVSVSNIPFTVSCTLENTETQILSPVKLGEMISIKGKFIEIDERMEMIKCLVLRRESVKDPV